MIKHDGLYVCEECGTELVPPEPRAPFAPFLVCGEAIGGDNAWVACSEACRDRLLKRYYRLLDGEEV